MNGSETASAAELHWASDAEPGVRRLRHGRHFRYVMKQRWLKSPRPVSGLRVGERRLLGLLSPRRRRPAGD